MAIWSTTQFTSQSMKMSALRRTRAQSPETLKSRLEALLAPLALLDKRLSQTLEVRNTLLGTAFEQFLLGSVVPTRPPASAIVPGSPLANLQQTFGLSDFDIEVVLMAIAPELDRRYERLYASLQSNGSYRPTVGLVLDLLCQSAAEKEKQRDRFDPTAPLRHHGLLQIKEHRIDSDCDNLTARLALNPTISRHLLGQPMTPQLSAYCQLSWPQETHHITNSPLLPDLLERLQQGQLPDAIALNFTGAGTKVQSANAIAATTQQPLLTVKPHVLFENADFSESEVCHIAQQIMLQGRLWNAILYIESEEAHNSDYRWLPADLIESISHQSSTMLRSVASHQVPSIDSLCAHLAIYDGIVIFTGQSPYLPTANQNKGILNIPFTPLPEDNLDSYWQLCLESTHVALSETDLFRQKLIEATEIEWVQ
ncbi:MAG: hypothetical protein AAFO84_12730 [Cyanobacteria bacterium J06598_1]